MYRFIRSTVFFLFYLIFWPKVKGRENIPKEEGIVLAGNHTSNLDWGLVMISTRRQIHFLAKKELFKNKLLRFFLNKMGIIPINRKEKNKEALELAKNYLLEDKVIGIFPESTINRKKESVVLPFKIGAVKISYDTKKKIVPFTIRGGFIPIFKRPVIEFYKPFQVKNGDLEEENNKFMNLIIDKLKGD